MFIKRLPVEGFNASLIKLPNQTYLGTIRKQIIMRAIPNSPKYPEVTNETYLFTLDANFNLLDPPRPLQDIPSRHKHLSYTTGLEDCRLISPTELLAVTLDTNPHWKPEMSHIVFDASDATIKCITPLSIQNYPRAIEKNWIYVDGNETSYLLWHSSKPFRFLEWNPKGKAPASVVKEYKGFDAVAHNATIVKIPSGYLGTVRIKKGHNYSHSLWLLFNDNLDIIATSDPFRFAEKEEANISYEMCMSLLLDDDTVYAVVSVNDRYSALYEFSLTQILPKLKPWQPS